MIKLAWLILVCLGWSVNAFFISQYLWTVDERAMAVLAFVACINIPVESLFRYLGRCPGCGK